MQQPAGHPRVTRRVLGWPNEPVREGVHQVVPLDRCTLTHDQRTGFLELRDPQDAPLALVYLGSVLSSGAGVMNFLRLLGQPFHARWSDAPPPPGSGGPIVFEPRLERSGVIVRRATWWIRSRHLHQVWFACQGARRLFDVAAELEAHGMPRIFFARLLAPREADRMAALGLNHRKPLWIDTANPLCLDLLERLALHGKWIMAREMLPEAGGLWTVIGGERLVAEIHLEMMFPVAVSEAEHLSGPGRISGPGHVSGTGQLSGPGQPA